MNKSRLKALFQNYIDNFENINNKEHDENYKWRIVQYFQDNFDLEADDLHTMLYDVWKATDNLIDNRYALPFYAVTEYAKNEPETVKKMFKALFADDGGNLKVRQNKIDSFIAESEELRERYFSLEAWIYKNDQRSVMTYLFLNDPDHHYLYKATQVREFADCVEFYDDIGPSTNFHLDNFYRLCDDLVSAIKDSPELIKTHLSRYDTDKGKMYDDKEFHILAFDIIYSSQVYGLYNDINCSHLDSKERQLYRERVNKAIELKMEYDKAEADYEKLNDIKQYILSNVSEDMFVSHKTFGKGHVICIDEKYITIVFEKVGEKRLGTLISFANALLKIDNSEFNKRVESEAIILKKEIEIKKSLKRALVALQPYNEYLNN